MNRKFRAVSLLLLFLAAAEAQNVSSSLSGVVQDSAAGVIAAAQLELEDQQTGFVRRMQTNHEGFFSFPDLTAATYRLTISVPGFKHYEQSALELTSSEKRSLGVIKLQVGQLTESITVTAENNPVMLASGERAAALSGQDIQDMALRGRDFMDAVSLLPGIVDTANGRDAPSADSMRNIFIAGGRENSKNLTVDGIVATGAGNGMAVITMPSMDAVGEMKVMMSNYSAENGRKSGGTISIITRGGGKDFHASAGWYHRHESLNANNFFNNRNGIDRSPYRYNIVSYSVGGPVYIPGKFNRDRSKLFFFFSQEFQRQLVNNGTNTVRVPTALERAGDFSKTFDLNGKLVPVRDPSNGKVQFPGNVVPLSRLNPIGRNILNLFPLPNFVDPSPARQYQWNYISNAGGAYPRDTETARVDYSPKDNVQLYARISRTGDSQDVTYGSWVNGSVNFPLTPIVFQRSSYSGVLHGLVTLSPTLFNEFSAGAGKNPIDAWPKYPDRVTRSATGITVPQWNAGSNPAGYIPNMSFAGVSNYANPSMNNPMPYASDSFQPSLVDNLSKVWNTHTFKFGGYFEYVRNYPVAAIATRGSLVFDVNGNNPLDTNYAYSNALLGNFSQYSEATASVKGNFRFKTLEAFAQDTWRVNRRLTLDYGVRFYHLTPMYDADNHLSAFLPSRYDRSQAPVLLRPGLDAKGTRVAVDPLTGTTYPVGYIGLFVPGIGNTADGMVLAGKDAPRGLYTIPAIAPAPRFGFAWDPFGSGKTSVRGGFGVFYDRVVGNPTAGSLGNPPFVSVPRVYYGTLDSLAATAGQQVLGVTGGVVSLYGSGRLPTVYNFSFGVQQQVSRGTVLDVSYVGSLARHMLWERNINPVAPRAMHMDVHPENMDPTTKSSLPANFLRYYQGYGDLFLYEFAATSNYHSLQASFVRRMSRGVQFAASYTFSKALGTADNDAAAVNPFFDPRRWDYGPLTYDRSHVFSARYTWKLPQPGKGGGPVVSAIAGGWELAGVTRFQTGAPFTPGYAIAGGPDITGTPSMAANIAVADPNAPPAQRFASPQRGTFGNAGTNILRLPGINNWDLSLYRGVRFTERLRAQLRLETYNTFNHTQFSNVVRNDRFDAAGNQIDPLFLTPSAARDGRRVQLAVRLNW